MPVIAIVGAGAGLGAAIARVFGRHGFQVALVSRSAAKVEDLARQLRSEGLDATGFAADITDAGSLETAFDGIRARYGTVDVFEFSPSDPGLAKATPLELSASNVQPQLDFYLYGAISAAAQVLPKMLAAGRGTLLFTTGGGSITPVAALANVNVAAAALRNWVLNLHEVVKPSGVFAAHVAISAWIGSGHPGSDADSIAAAYYELYEARDRPELHYVALPTT